MSFQGLYLILGIRSEVFYKLERTIYRIENPTTMHGMWYDIEGNYRPSIFDLCPDSIAKDFPMGFDEAHKRNGKKWFSAGKSEENMRYWFSKADAQALYNNGYKLYKFVVNEYYEKEHEILFTREGVVSQVEMSIEEIWGKNNG